MQGNKNLFGVEMFSVKRKSGKQQKKVLIFKSAYFGPLCSASVSGSVIVALELAIEFTRNRLSFLFLYNRVMGRTILSGQTCAMS